MVDALNLRNLAWALTTLFEIILFSYIIHRRVYRTHQAFTLYCVVALLQGVLVAIAYSYFGSQSIQYFNIAWGAQTLVVCARWLAVIEIARKLLNGYSGIWRMASRILFVAGAMILAYSMAVSRMRWDLMITSADRAVELCIGVFIVSLFLFARYYRLAISSLERQLAIGFCLFSCFWVINDSLYQHWGSSVSVLWEISGIFSLLASLLLWISAVRSATQPHYSTVRIPAVSMSARQYQELSQELDSRLKLLDSRLNHLLRSEDSRS